MQPLVQSAIDAANRGETNQALEFCKQALAANPNDVDAWLVVAAVVEQPERKRQCLNRVLSLDPVNQIARDELLEMDRLAMGAPPAQPAPVPNSPAIVSSQVPYSEVTRLSPDPGFAPALSAAPRVEPPASPGSSSTSLKKPLVFSYSPRGLKSLYIFGAIGLGMGCLLVVAQDVGNSLRYFIPALFMIAFALSVSSKVVISETGVLTSSLLSSAEVKWKDIARIQSDSAKRKLKLISKKGEAVKISTQVQHYHLLIEILRQKRPDLFGTDVPSPAQGKPAAPGYDQPPSTSAPAFTGTKIFKKGFFRLYGLTFGGIFFCLILIFIVFSIQDAHWDVFSIGGTLLAAAFGGFLMVAPFLQVGTIKVEPRKLTLATFFGETEISASQIEEIRMESVQQRRGEVKNFVKIIANGGKNYPLADFAAGDEIIYGFLMNWWNAYRDK
jgi:hypothetical protein